MEHMEVSLNYKYPSHYPSPVKHLCEEELELVHHICVIFTISKVLSLRKVYLQFLSNSYT